MPDTIQGAIHARLAATLAVTSRVALYKGAPAVIAAERIPEDAPLPAVVVKPPDGDDPADTKTSQHRELAVTIDVVANSQAAGTGQGAVTSQGDLGALALAVRDALHRVPVSVPGYTGWRATVRGPSVVPTDGKVHARRLIVELGLHRA